MPLTGQGHEIGEVSYQHGSARVLDIESYAGSTGGSRDAARVTVLKSGQAPRIAGLPSVHTPYLLRPVHRVGSPAVGGIDPPGTLIAVQDPEDRRCEALLYKAAA